MSETTLIEIISDSQSMLKKLESLPESFIVKKLIESYEQYYIELGEYIRVLLQNE